jgi:hypothetical protein
VATQTCTSSQMCSRGSYCDTRGACVPGCDS